MVAVNPIGEPGRASGGSDDGIEIVFGEDGVDTLGASEFEIVGKSIEIGLVGEWAFGLSVERLA